MSSSDRADTSHLVERTVPGNGRHPSQRRSLYGIEFVGLPPDPNIGLLKTVGRAVALVAIGATLP
jgi:hypothetical protein